MLMITESAWNRLSTIQSTRPEILALRLIYVDGKVKCRKGVAKTNDEVIEQQGHPKLLLSRKLSKRFEERTLDTIEADHGSRLRLK